MPLKFVAALLALIIAAGRALAQDVEKEPQRPKIEQQRQTQEADVAENSAKLKVEGASDVTYDQILANPDDLELNYNYARAQVRRGDLKGASATLERMLLIDPNRSDIRLFYSVVLYRLDNVIEAQRELLLLSQQKLSSPMDSEVGKYLALVSRRLKKNHLSGRASIGFQYDTNRNAAPASGRRLFSDIPIPLSPSSQRRDDTSVLFLGRLEYRRNVAQGHELFTSADYYRAEQTLVKTINLQAYSLQTGAALRRGRDFLTPALVFDHALLAQSSFLRARGVDLRYEHKVGKRGNVYVQLRDVYQDYVKNAVVPTADERDGIQVDLTGGGDYVLGPTMRIGGGYTHSWKHAQRHYNAFKRNGVSVNHIWLLGRGTFLLSNGSLNYDNFNQPDAALSAKERRDTTWRASATYGVPLTLLNPKLQDLLLTFTYEYYQALSTVENFAYTNNKVGTLLTYKFDLGF